jgi:deoxyribodipyrimidine photo-lyase
MDELFSFSQDPRVTVRRAGQINSADGCVVYWMQRAQRGIDNTALDIAVEAANALRQPVVAFLAPVPSYLNANLRHYRFLAEGIPDIAAALAKRNVGFVLRRFPEHSLLRFCDEVKAALVVGDENPMREPEEWRRTASKKLKAALWTVDADVIVPSKLLEKPQYAAHIIRPRLKAQLKRFLIPSKNPHAIVPWKKPSVARTEIRHYRGLEARSFGVSSFRLARRDGRGDPIAERFYAEQVGGLRYAAQQARERPYQPTVAVSALRTYQPNYPCPGR